MTTLRRLAVTGSGIALALGVALGGFDTPDGRYNGEPLGQAESAQVQRAINALSSAGYADQASQLQAAFDRGDICKETNAPVCGAANTPASTSSTGSDAQINVSCDYLLAVVDVLASVLLHEMRHFQITGVPDDEEHCMIYYEEYLWLTFAFNTSATGSFASKKIQAELDAILAMYPNFDDQEWPGYPTFSASTTATYGRKAFTNLVAGRGQVYYCSGGSTIYVNHWVDATETFTTTTLTVPFDVTRDIHVFRTPSGIPTAVAVGTNSAGTNGAVCVIRDTNSDCVLDSVQSVVEYSSGLVSPNGICWVDSTSGPVRWYVLESSEGKIWRLADSDSDGVPDGLGSVYAGTALCPDITMAKGLARTGTLNSHGEAAGATYVAITSDSPASREATHDSWWVSFEDSNSDGTADGTLGLKIAVADIHYQPTLRAGGQQHDNYVMVKTPAGHQVQVLGWNATTQMYDVVRGSGTVPSGTPYVTIAVSPNFSLGETFKLKDTTTGKTTAAIEVVQKTPAITAMSPTTGPRAGGTVVTLEGRNFGNNPTVTFGTTTAAIISQSETTIVVETPNVGTNSQTREVKVTCPGGKVARHWYFVFRN